MTDLEARLEHALKADAPAPRDPMFRIEILARRERAAFRRRLLVGGATAFGVAVVAALALGAAGKLVGAGPWPMVATTTVGLVLVTLLIALNVGGLATLRGFVGRWPALTRALHPWR